MQISMESNGWTALWELGQAMIVPEGEKRSDYPGLNWGKKLLQHHFAVGKVDLSKASKMDKVKEVGSPGCWSCETTSFRRLCK